MELLKNILFTVCIRCECVCVPSSLKKESGKCWQEDMQGQEGQGYRPNFHKSKPK
jgi:hypothetical protein